MENKEESNCGLKMQINELKKRIEIIEKILKENKKDE